MKYFYSRSLFALGVFFTFSQPLKAQEESLPIEAEVYLDTYYAWESSKMYHKSPDQAAGFNSRLTQPIGYENQAFQVNTAQVTLRTRQNKWYRASTTLQVGTLALSSWPADQRYLQEAYLGLNLLPNHTAPMWLDTGIFFTHIGSESVLPRYNKLSLLSLLSVFEPYFQSGVRLSYDISSQIAVELSLLNGYGNIQDNNQDKSLGWKIQYVPSASLTASLAGLAGNEKDTGNPFTLRQYHNLNLKYLLSNGFQLQAQADLAFEESAVYCGAQTTLTYQASEQLAFSTRLSSFQDPESIISPGIAAYGITLGAEYKPTEESYIRAEGRQIFLSPQSRVAFQYPDDTTSNTRTEFLVTTGIWW